MSQPLFNRSIRWRLLILMAGLSLIFSITLILIHSRSHNELAKLALKHALAMEKELLMQRGRITSDDLKERMEGVISSSGTTALSNVVTSAFAKHSDLVFVSLTETSSGTMLVYATQTNQPSPSMESENKATKADMIDFTEIIMVRSHPWGTLKLGFSTCLLYTSPSPRD